MKTLLLALALAAWPALTPASQPTEAPKAAYTEGEVKRVDKAARTIALKHGPIANLDMPAMSMTFPAKDARLLERVREGDRVRFRAEKVAGTITVIDIEPVK